MSTTTPPKTGRHPFILFLAAALAAAPAASSVEATQGANRPPARPSVSLAVGTTADVVSWPDGTVWTWSHERASRPRTVVGASGIFSVAARGERILALDGNGRLWAWGHGGPPVEPELLTGLEPAKAIAAGENHALSLQGDGTVLAWSAMDARQLADTPPSFAGPALVRDLSEVTAIAAGETHSLAVTADGRVWVWGGTAHGESGSETSATPVALPGLEDAVAVAAGRAHDLALRRDGSVWEWSSSPTREPVAPSPVDGLFDVVAVAAGADHSLALRRDGTVWAWGRNDHGQLGDGSDIERNEPVQVEGLVDVVAIAAGRFRSLVATRDGSLWAWGGEPRAPRDERRLLPTRFAQGTPIPDTAAEASGEEAAHDAGDAASRASAAAAAAPEVCGDGQDNNGNALADEGCYPTAVTGVCESPLSCAKSGAVSPKTGALVYHVDPDIKTRVPYGPNLVLRRFYTSQYNPGYFPNGVANHTHPLGIGWQHNYMSWLKRYSGTKPTVVVHTTTGQDVLFTRQNANVNGWDEYSPQPGFEFKVLRQRVVSPFDWELHFGDGTVHGYGFNTGTAIGKLTQIRDGVARSFSPNAVVLTYNQGGQLFRVMDVAGYRYLEFTYETNGKKLLKSVSFFTNPSAPTRVVQRDFVYDAAGHLTTLQTVSGLRTRVDERYGYNAGGRLIDVIDGAGIHSQAAFAYTASGAVARVRTSEGNAGYRYDDPTCNAGQGTVLFFNKAATGTCTSDASCGVDGYCGGKDASGTGMCYRAKRCMAYETPGEHLVTAINAPSCPGCLFVERYVYDLGPSVDLTRLAGVQLGPERRTTYEYDANGNTIRAVHGDDDFVASNGGPADSISYYFFYGDPLQSCGTAQPPNKLTEERAQSRLSTLACDRDHAGGCERRLYCYNASGQIASLTEKGFTLDVTGAVSPFGYTTTLEYTPNGQLAVRRGPRPVADNVDYTYDADGRLRWVTVTPAPGSSLTYSLSSYDEYGNPRLSLDPSGTGTCSTYDEDGRVVSIRTGVSSCAGSGGNTYTFEYLGRRRDPLKMTLPRGNCIKLGYDAEGRPDRMLAADAGTSGCGLDDSAGDVAQLVRDAEGLITVGRLTDETGAVKWQQDRTLGPDKRLHTLGNPMDATAYLEFSWTPYGRLSRLKREDFEETGAQIEQVTDWLANPTALREFTDFATSRQWDLARNATQLPDVVTQVRDPGGHTVDVVRDDLGRLVRRKNADGGTTDFVYDEAGNLVKRLDRADTEDDRVTSFSYDNANRLTSVDTADDPCGPTSGTEIKYTWDAPPAGSACPAGSTCERQEGRLAHVKTKLYCASWLFDQAFDQQTFYSYTAAGQIKEATVKDDNGRISRVGYTYDANGNMTSIDYPWREPSGSPTGPAGSATGAVYTYGGAASVADDDKVVSVGRGSAASAATVLDQITWYPYGPVKLFRQMNYFWHCSGFCMGFLPTVTYTRNLAYRTTQITADTAYPDHLFRVNLSEDKRGRVTKRDFDSGSPGQKDTCFLYDTLDRATCQAPTLVDGSCAATCDAGGAPPLYSISYGPSNDRTSFVVGNAALGPSAQTYTVTYRTLADGTPTDQLDSLARSDGGTIDFDWDAWGNRLFDDDSAYGLDDRREYTYDGRSNLVKVTGRHAVFSLPGGYSMQPYELRNAYDDRNRRVFKSFKDTETGAETQWFFTYDIFDRLIEARLVPNVAIPGAFLVHQWYWLADTPILHQLTSNSGAVEREYLYSDERNRPHAAWSWPTTSANPTRVWEVEAGLFGWDVPLPAGNGFYQPLRFPGQYYDAEIEAVTLSASGARQLVRPGLADNRFRVYDSFTGSYLQVDPLVASTQTSYTYAHNDPVNRIDPQGLEDSHLARGGCPENATSYGTLTDAEGSYSICACNEGYVEYDDSFGWMVGCREPAIDWNPPYGGSTTTPDGFGGGGPYGGGGHSAIPITEALVDYWFGPHGVMTIQDGDPAVTKVAKTVEIIVSPPIVGPAIIGAFAADKVVNFACTVTLGLCEIHHFP